MKKLIVFILFGLSTVISAQNEQQGIELPDFVITGKQTINIPTAKKEKPEFIPTLSQAFFTPTFNPEELPLMIFSDPVSIVPSIEPYKDYYNFSLKAEVGRYSFPTGEFNINQSLESYLFNAKIWGSNIKEYVPNSGYNTSGVSMTNEFFISTRSEFLPGAVIKITGDYSRDSYRLFASQDPTFLRETGKGSGLFSISSRLNRWINYGAEVNGNILTASENGFKEILLKSNAYFDFKWNNFTFGFNGNYQRQNLTNNLSADNSYNYYSGEGYAKLIPTDNFQLTAGASYAASGNNSFLTPFASLEFKINDNVTVDAEFKPRTKFFTVNDFLKKNLYYNFGMNDNVFEKYDNSISGLIRYEYDKYITVALSGGYQSIKNYFYFDDSANLGKFDLATSSVAKVLFSKLDFYYYTNIYGYFLGEVTYRDITNDAGYKIPYEPLVSSSLTYGYDFDFHLGLKASYNMAIKAYTDLANTTTLEDFHNLSLTLNYELLKGLKLTLDFQNILNRSNFVWKQYQEKPFDILGGIEYRW